MEQHVCKNKKCQKRLPYGYKHKYCENCRNEKARIVKVLGETVIGLVMVGGSLLKTIIKKD